MKLLFFAVRLSVKCKNTTKSKTITWQQKENLYALRKKQGREEEEEEETYLASHEHGSGARERDRERQ